MSPRHTEHDLEGGWLGQGRKVCSGLSDDKQVTGLILSPGLSRGTCPGRPNTPSGHHPGATPGTKGPRLPQFTALLPRQAAEEFGGRELLSQTFKSLGGRKAKGKTTRGRRRTGAPATHLAPPKCECPGAAAFQGQIKPVPGSLSPLHPGRQEGKQKTEEYAHWQEAQRAPGTLSRIGVSLG